MQINNQPQNKNINFTALPIVRAVTYSDKKTVTLYKLNQQDIPFVNKFLKELDIRNFYPNEKDTESLNHWQNIIHNAFKRICAENVILAAYKNKPCGVIAFSDNPNVKTVISRFATWPIGKEKKVPHVGKMLLHCVFKHDLSNNIRNVSLIPASITPRGKSCIDFYEKAGFITFENIKDKNKICRILNADLNSYTANLEHFFKIQKLTNQKEVNLNKKLSIEYMKPPLYKRIFISINNFFDFLKFN